MNLARHAAVSIVREVAAGGDILLAAALQYPLPPGRCVWRYAVASEGLLEGSAMSKTLLFLVTALLCLGSATWAGEGDASADDVIERLFGQKIRDVVRQNQPQAAGELARELLDAAGSTGDNHDLRIALVVKAAELAARGDDPAFIVFEQAVEQLRPIAAGQIPIIYEHQFTFLERRFRTTSRAERNAVVPLMVQTAMTLGGHKLESSDAAAAVGYYRRASMLAGSINPAAAQQITPLLNLAQLRTRVNTQRDQWQNALTRQPDQHDLRLSLGVLLLVEYDDPAEAAEVLKPFDPEPVARTVAQLLLRDRPLEAAEFLSVADFFSDAVEQTRTDIGKANAASRAITGYQRFLDLHTEGGAKVLHARVMLQRMTDLYQTVAYAHQLLPDSSQAGAARREPLVTWTSRQPTRLVDPQNPRQGFIGVPEGNLRLIAGTAQFTGGHILFADAGRAVANACKASNELSIEFFGRPGNATQRGPARILGVSQGFHQRNFTLGQNGPNFNIRIRTPRTGNNGSSPDINFGTVDPEQDVHIVVTYRPGTLRIYLNGELATETDRVTGDFSNWVDNMPLIMGDETVGGRAWNGRMYRAAIYNRVLGPGEVKELFEQN